MASMADANAISDINLLARFLAHTQLHDLSSYPPVDCVIICVSAVFHGAETLFRSLEARPDFTKSLVLCGGIGHSTPLIYDAVVRNTTYHPLAKEAAGLPEARVLYRIMERYFNISAITREGCKILIEDKSTNCAANAIETRKVLEGSGLPTPKTCIVIQDPTMALRTIASFEKAYVDLEIPPKFLSCPVFIPEMEWSESGPQFAVVDVPAFNLWKMDRFLDLIMGEIPRLRDDEGGYGPNGKGSIAHVDIPPNVEEAWQRLQGILANSR